MAMLLVLSFALAAGTAAAAGGGDSPSSVLTKPTPFGPRPVECVVEVPNGAHVDEDASGFAHASNHARQPCQQPCRP